MNNLFQKISGYFTKKNVIRFILIFLISFGLFFGLTVFSNRVLSAYDVTSARLSPVLNPILSIAFGYPAAIGCAIANLVSDIVSGYKPFVCIFGVFSQLLYGLLPYYLWKLVARSESHKTRLDSPKKTIYFVLLMLINSLIVALFVGLFQLYTSGSAFLETTIYAFLNDFDVCVVLGLPLMALIDLIYSRNHQIRKRKLSLNERIILFSGILQLTSFALIALITCLVNQSFTNSLLWKNIFIYSLIAMNAILIASIVLMYVLGNYKKQKVGLRIFEKANGTIYVDEAKHIEFVSYPSLDFSKRVKSNLYSNTYESIYKNYTPRYEDAWQVTLSNQKGCPMKCTFCDCPGYGFHGNISLDEFKYQIESIIDNVGVTHTNLFIVDFMRMGEPTLNFNIIEFIEFELKKSIESKVDAKKIYPTISTMLPKNAKENVLKFLLEYTRIKNDVYGGEADLQFSINTTDELTRRKIFKNMSMSLAEISEIGKALPMPKGSKYALNFAVSKDTVIDLKLLDELFDKKKFLIKLTPIHLTFNAIDNGFVNSSVSETDEIEMFKKFEAEFIKDGWDYKIFIDKKEADDDSITCGNSILANISDRFVAKQVTKKRIGLVVAIEIDAIFKMYPEYKEIECPDGFKCYFIEKDTYELYVLKSGMGEVGASAATEYLIARYNVSMIINFGVVGGLTSEMKKQKVCLVEKVVHYKYDCSEFTSLAVGQVDGHDSIYLKTDEKLVQSVMSLMDNIKLVTCCSGDKFVATAEEKSFLHKRFNGDICDMESSGIVLTCELNKVPCLLFKAVSDGLNDGAEGFYAELEKASLKCLKVADKIIDKLSKIE